MMLSRGIEDHGGKITLREGEIIVISNPPESEDEEFKQVLNIYVRMVEGKPLLRIEFEDGIIEV